MQKEVKVSNRRRRRLLLNQEEQELAMRPVLPWHIIHRIQVGPNALPNRLVPQTLEKTNTGHWENASSTRLSGQQTLQHEVSTHFRALSSATIGSLRCSSHKTNRVSFSPGCCLHDVDDFRFLGFMWLLNPRCPAHFLNQSYNSSQSSTSIPLQIAWQKACQSASTKAEPTSPLQCDRHWYTTSHLLRS